MNQPGNIGEPMQSGPTQTPNNNVDSRAYRSDDEIDLVDLGVSLIQRWKLMLVVILACLASGVFWVLKRSDSPVYTYTATVQLARNAVNGNIGRLLFDEQTAKSLLEKGLVDMAISQYAEKHKGFDAAGISITVEAPKRTAIIYLVGTGPARLQSAYEDIERTAVKLLRESPYNAANSARRAVFKGRYEKARLQLQALQDPQQREARMLALKRSLLTAQVQLERLKRQQQVLKGELVGIDKSRKLNEQLSRQLHQYLSKAGAESLQALNAKTASEAMAGMLLSGQTQRGLQQLAQVDERLAVELPRKEARIKASIANNVQQQSIQRSAVEQAKIKYVNFQSRWQRSIKSQQITVAQLKARLDNLQDIQLVGNPVRAPIRGGRHSRLIILASALLGIFLAVFAVLLANYLAAIRLRFRLKEQAPQEDS